MWEGPFVEEMVAFPQRRSALQASSSSAGLLMEAASCLAARTLYESRRPNPLQMAAKRDHPTNSASWRSMALEASLTASGMSSVADT